MNDEKAEALAGELGDAALALHCDVTSEDEVKGRRTTRSRPSAASASRSACAGVGWAERTVSKNGPHQLMPFETVVRVNLIGMFNVLRIAASAMNENEPGEDGERGAVVMTASIAAFDGQIGQISYSASKGGIVGHDAPRRARPGRPRHPRRARSPPACSTPPCSPRCPRRRARRSAPACPSPSASASPPSTPQLACSIAENRMLNGETIRLDGALRMPPK